MKTLTRDETEHNTEYVTLDDFRKAEAAWREEFEKLSRENERLVGLALARRREWLCRNAPKCDACGEIDQIQLSEWLFTPATWRCRRCDNKFDLEPSNLRQPPLPADSNTTPKDAAR
jgi:hypothetical protein